MRPAGPQVVRSMRRGDAARNKKVTRGTTMRILRFAAPYRGLLLLFLGVVIVEAAMSAVSPLFLRQIINRGIVGKDAALVVKYAIVVAALALGNAGLSMGERAVSARVGLGPWSRPRSSPAAASAGPPRSPRPRRPDICAATTALHPSGRTRRRSA